MTVLIRRLTSLPHSSFQTQRILGRRAGVRLLTVLYQREGPDESLILTNYLSKHVLWTADA